MIELKKLKLKPKLEYTICDEYKKCIRDLIQDEDV